MTLRFSTAFAVLPVCCSALTPLAAADDTSPLHVAALDPVVITPTLSSRTVDASLSSVTVIDEQQLRRQQPVEFTDVLRGQPGIDVTGNGSFGKATSVFIRGTGSSSSLLLLNGVRLRSATAGNPSWQFLPASLISRVEVVRGPRGSLYGADAMGGVVQVFTDRTADGAFVEAGAGTFNTRHLAAGASGESEGTRYTLGVDRFDTDGTELRENSGDRGYDNTSGVINLTHRFDNDAELGVFAFRAEGTTEFEGSTPAQERTTDYALQAAGVHGGVWVSDNWLSKLQISDARDESEGYTDGNRSNFFNTRSRAASWQNFLLFGDHELVIGGDFLRDSVESSTVYDEDERDNSAGFAQLLLNFGAFDIQASGRYDDNEAFGGETTGGLAVGYKVTPHHRVRASYATAFRAPSFNELYYPGFGNPELEAEKSKSLELGVRGQWQTWFWDLALYETNVDDLIGTADIGFGLGSYNVDEARIRGAELTSGLEWNQWRLAAAASIEDPRDRDTGNVLQRRAKRSLRLDADRQLGDVSLGGTLVLKSDRYNDAENEEPLPGFGTLDLRADWRFAPRWSARLAVKNVLDKSYATSTNYAGWDYLNAGRFTMLNLRYELQ
ncbi:TonB-dependent receptor domain-containing protein [Alloalcanivorax marinus]|uniref:TonB-dependent receptor domain-containing protein n=1 Tax=Alloalcanivorax marinus TaxID=1177169 RepID=UPI001934B03B|nr:TonB-dependent receptor [Alloalcanivorax marinus]MBL7252668.1 TonB-dependent receptor [Alloalcanivorax marinus]